MKPVAIFRHSATEGPGYFATVLDAHRIPWRLTKIDAGEPVPEEPQAFSGLCFMGGPMSVNDDLPWIAPVLDLIRAAVRSEIPVIGHCLGGQLMAKALGGLVSRNPVKEIGWGTARAVEGDAAQRWLGELREFLAFHWHGETFSIPTGAARILESPFCANQAFALGPHLALQCHVEMTPELIRAWCRDWDKEVAALAKLTPSVQTPAQIIEDIEPRVRDLNAVADRLYARWIEGLRD
ncbi:MAG: type 1 glutamine amidotransferase [Betaproteobacteria bacterium]|nr:type 1 glutamine amidotransferase [Betaproteobacteria bacterium]